MKCQMPATIDFIGGAEGIRTPDLLNAIKIPSHQTFFSLVLSFLFCLVCY